MKVTSMQDHGATIARVTVETLPKEVSYLDILGTVKVIPDEFSDAPWKECDGFEHQTTKVQHLDYDVSDARGYANPYHGPAILVSIPKGISEKWGIWDKIKGESKQQAFERAAANVARTLEYITKIYDSGDYDVWIIRGNFMGYGDSLGGYYGLKDAEKDGREQVALEIAAQMESDGFTVTNKPEPPSKLQQLKNRMVQDDRAILVHSASWYRARHNRRHHKKQ